MKKLLIILILLPVLSNAQVHLDSLWGVWNDETQADTNRLKAMKDISWKGYLFTQPDSAFYFAQLQLNFAKEKGQKKHMAIAFNTQGVSFYMQGDYAKSIEYFSQSLKINEEIGDKKGIANSLNNIGLIYNDQGESAKAIEYYSQSVKLDEEMGNKQGIAASLTNIGSVYNYQGEFAKAIEYFSQGLKIFEENGNKQGIANSLNNIGNMHEAQGKTAKAIVCYTRSLKIFEEIGDKMGIAMSLNNIGLCYKDRGKLLMAMDYSKRSLALAQEIGLAGMIRSSSELLWEVNKRLGHHKESLKMYELFIATRDSMESETNQKAVIQQEYKYAYEKRADSVAIEQVKKDELALAEEQRKEDVAAKENENKNLIIGSGATGLGLVVLFTFFIINRLRITRKQKNIIEIQKTEVEEQKEVVEKAHDQLEEKNNEIMDSISYAKRIQSAILPPSKLVKEYLSESFILYKPKDVVAGDFYWMEHKDNKVLFAAADCTGHGVPGALVSVICNNGLNRSVKEYALTDPAEILDKTRDIVISEFEKSEEEVKDGMDIALCSLEGNTLKYAGANNPLWIVRNGEILETKANKQPIGKYTDPKHFTTHVIELEKGDSIYIFSDGYVDQFGGEKGKKFKPANLRKLLLSIQDESMEKQKELLDESFEKWKGDLEQIDDVCMIGVKI